MERKTREKRKRKKRVEEISQDEREKIRGRSTGGKPQAKIAKKKTPGSKKAKTKKWVKEALGNFLYMPWTNITQSLV